jgi:hypothetical protein
MYWTSTLFIDNVVLRNPSNTAIATKCKGDDHIMKHLFKLLVVFIIRKCI